METNEEKQLKLDKRYIRMAGIWAKILIAHIAG